MFISKRNESKIALSSHMHGVAFAIICLFGFTYISSHHSLWTYGTILIKFPYFPIYGPAALFLLCIYYLDILEGRRHIRFIGTISAKLCVVTLFLVSVVYISSWFYIIYGGGDIENAMVALHKHIQSASALQLGVLSLSLLLLVPFTEEILYRHFLLGIFNFPPSLRIQLPLVVVVALFFSWQHSNYENTVTFIELFLLACIFGCARVFSGGIALPIALHAYAVFLGVTLNEIAIRFVL